MRNLQIICVLLQLYSISSFGQSKKDFVGTWELVSIERKSESGYWESVSGPGGGEAKGILMYDDEANMAVQITSVPRKIDHDSDNPNGLVGYLAYYGTYEIDIESQSVIHHRKYSINPIREGNSAVRYYQFNEGVLTLTVAPEGTPRLNWTRIK